VKNEEVFLQRVKKQRNILRTIKRRKANWIGHILIKNCLLQHVTEEKTKERVNVKETRERRSKQLPYNLNEMRLYSNVKAKSTTPHSVENQEAIHL
jgi:hypothetical protein